MTVGFVTSRDGTRLAYRTAGDPALPPIVLIHGWAQYHGCWIALMDQLADRHHLVAIDLRGHGGSDKPEADAAYTDTAIWGDDVHAVIEELGLIRPILVGWSYGSRVIAAYLATHGNDDIAGVVLTSGVLAIGSAREDWMVGAASPGLDRDLYTEDTVRRLAATARFVAACTTRPLPRQAFAEYVGANMLCPAHVRRALFAANVDLGPVYAAMSCPGLVIHGTADTVVTPRTAQTAAGLMKHGRYLPYDGIGHAPFLEDPDRFATDLHAFAASVTEPAA